VPATPNRAELLKEQLQQMAWSGELEGWLTKPPRWHLVANETSAAIWQPLFQSWLGSSVPTEAPASAAQLLTQTANRAAQTEPRLNVLPPDYGTRYRQQFIDRLWIRGLTAVLGVYILVVFGYAAAVQWQGMELGSKQREVSQLSLQYTNTLQLKARLGVLENRQALKFAALDCLRATAELLPESLTLSQFDFRNGKTMVLHGTAPPDEAKLVTDFNEGLHKVTRPTGELLFEKIEPPVSGVAPGGGSLSWSFSADLARGEASP
jgi:hypothetical protein